VRGKATPPRIDRKDGFSRITGQIPRADGKRLFDTQLELNADERLTDALQLQPLTSSTDCAGPAST
jgi:hypothetical protein